MLAFDEFLETLGYQNSPHYRSRNSGLQPETAHIFRAAFQDEQVQGVYVFEASPDGTTLPARPVVYVAKANTEDEAREIHRRLWNLSYAPFIVVKLPQQIRIYTGFGFSEENPKEGWLDTADEDEISRLVAILSADAIDSGGIWDSELAKSININQRVDKKLLKDLRELGKILKKSKLSDEVAHALIGKYVYFNYLRDRNILTDAWLMEQNIEPDSIFTLHATVDSLNKLVNALENRFNGQIFPIDFEKAQSQSLEDKHISWVASIFSGNEIIETAPQELHQLHLPFQAYNFRYLPVETFSAIYEQFIDNRKEKGAIYTPEYLADYLLSEVEGVKPLQIGEKILDPACGSGVFLVLVYRRLIEKESTRLGRRPTPEELKSILEQSIYGIERERDACYVTEFSLILTLLHYVHPPELEKLDFKFPNLHNERIFEGDFFDLEGEESEVSFWQKGFRFDWIIGNPSWASTLDSERDKFALQWIAKKDYPVSGQRVAEAFSWLVTELLNDTGIIGLLLPATSLFNLNSKQYRQAFFTEHEVLRITNFANLRDVLFGKGKSDVLPAATFVYRPSTNKYNKSDIIHYGPFAANQVTKVKQTPWTITVNESEIQALSAYEAEKGETSFWKFALWGTHLDRDAIERIEYLFPLTLGSICEKYSWNFQEGSQLRDINKGTPKKLKYIAWLRDKKLFNTKAVKASLYRFSIGPNLLEDIPEEKFYIRIQGGEKGLDTTWAPHIIISPVWKHYIIYSDEDFVLPPRQIGIAASKGSIKNTVDYLKAISIYLRSSLVAYYLFFHAQQWGVFRRARLVSTTEVGNARTPDLTLEQALMLSDLHERLVEKEKQKILALIRELRGPKQGELSLGQIDESYESEPLDISKLTPAERKKLRQQISTLRAELQSEIDEKVFEIFEIPEDIQLLVRDFVKTRLALDKASTTHQAIQHPKRQDLLVYAKELQNELDEFAMGTAFHQVAINHSDELIECIVEIKQESESPSPKIDDVRKSNLSKAMLLSQLSEKLREQVSQWVYVRRSLYLFDGPRTYIYKSPRLINWTRTQAISDAGDIIGEVITKSQNYEASYT